MAETLADSSYDVSLSGTTDHPHADGESGHVLPIKTYLRVYGALLLLTGLTIQVSLLDLGTASILIALTVAAVKAGFVAGYFMHLRYDARFHTLVFLSSVLFLGIFLSLTMIDLGSRDSVVEQEGNFVLRDDESASPSGSPGASPVATGAPAPGGSPSPSGPGPAPSAPHH